MCAYRVALTEEVSPNAKQVIGSVPTCYEAAQTHTDSPEDCASYHKKNKHDFITLRLKGIPPTDSNGPRTV